MPRPPPPVKSPPPPPRIKSAIIRPLAPQPRPLQKLRPATGQPRKKSRQFAPGALSRYNSAAKTERPAARPPAKRSRGEKSPHPPGTHTPTANPRKKSGNLRREPCPVTTAPQRRSVPPPANPAKNPGNLRREPCPVITAPPKGKSFASAGNPYPPPANPAKKSGRLPRSATFPLFKRRKMRYTGKEIHPDTEDET